MGFTVIVCLSAAGPPLLSDVRPGEEQGGDVAVIGQLIERLDQALFEARLEAELPPAGF
jgi:hypothetical protein